MAEWIKRLWSLRRDARLRYLSGDVVSKGLSFTLFILIARHVGVADFGWISLYVTLTGLLTVAVGAGLPNTIVPFRFSHGSFPEVLGTTLTGLTVSCLVVGCLVAAIVPPVGAWLEIPSGLFWLAIPGAIAIAFRNAWLSSLRAQTLSGHHAISQVAEATLFALAIAVLILLSRDDYRPVLVAYSGPTAALGLFGVIRWSRNPGLRVNPLLFAPLLRFALPMIFHAFAMTGLATLDQILVNRFLGAEGMGTYAFGYRFGMSMAILSAAFSAAWVPEFLELARRPDGYAAIRLKAGRHVNGMIAAALVLMLILPPLARLLGGPAFVEGSRIIPLVVYAYLWFVLYTLVFAHALHTGRTAPIAIATTAALAVNIWANYLLIPRFELVGAALASVVGYVALFAFQLAAHRDVAVVMPLGALAARVAVVGLLPIALLLLG